MPKKDKPDRRKTFYTVDDNSYDPARFKGYAPMGSPNVSKINENFIITGTIKLSRFAVRQARNAGMIFGG